jgi:hypothetical protein
VNVVVLDTGLFPEQETLTAALDDLTPAHYVYRYDLRVSRSEEEWDQLMDEVLSADRVFTV